MKTQQAAVGTFVVALSVYLLTLAPDITWAHFGNDGGELITAAVTLGVPHPPGYSTYTLLGHLISKLPIGTVAYRFNLFSALAMAAACAVVSLSSAETFPTLSRKPIAALAAGLTLAFTPAIWKQAVITEVYALNLLLLALLLLAIVRRVNPFVVGLLWGLSMTTHLTSLLWLPLLAFALWKRRWLLAIVGLLVGLLPLAALPLLASGSSPVVWGDARTLSGWWWLVSGAIYRPNVLSFTHVMPQLRDSLPALVLQLIPMQLGVAVIGISALRPKQASQQTIRSDDLQFAGALLLVAAAYAAYAVSYDAFDYTVFALPALLLLTPLLYAGYAQLSYASLILPLLLLSLNFSAVNLHGDTQVRQRAETALAQLPANALVITPGDQTPFSLWYFHFVEGQRPDIVPIDANMLAFDWYRNRMADRYADVAALRVDDLAALRAQNQAIRPICDLTIDPAVSLSCSSQNTDSEQ